MSKLAKSIDTHGYDLTGLLFEGEDETQMGGAGLFNDLQIPLGLYYDEKVVYDFYKVAKSSVIEDELFDNLFNLVSKTKSKPTRKNVVKPNKTTRRA